MIRKSTMTLFRCLGLLLVGFISACVEPNAAARPDEQRLGPGEHVLTLTSGGLERLTIVYVPPSYDGKKSVPMVILFHGGGGRASGIRRISSMDRVADTHGFVVVYPQGLNRVWNDGGSDLGQRPPRDDIGFVRELVKDVSRKVSVNSRQVFACGFSNGGALTARLILEAPDLLAAGAMVGSGLYAKQMQDHPHPKPMPVLFIEGTQDPCHPYQGGEAIGPRMDGLFKGEHHGVVLSSDAVVSFWRKTNGCEGKPEVIELPHKTRDNTSTTYRRWTGASGNDVAEYIVQGGGHCWPGGLQYFPVAVIGKTSYDFDASEAIWQFFERHHPHAP
jgi:polyhydroxybutyrate depolymerase